MELREEAIQYLVDRCTKPGGERFTLEELDFVLARNREALSRYERAQELQLLVGALISLTGARRLDRNREDI